MTSLLKVGNQVIVLKIFIIFIFIVLSFTALPAEERTYTFVGAYFPQISEQLPSGELRGLGIEITDMVAKKMGIKIDIQIYPLLRAIEIMKQGKADGIIGAYQSEERSKFINYSEKHFYEDPISLYKHKKSKLKWNGDLKSLKNRRIGVIRGWSLGEKFDANKEQLNILYVNYLSQLISMLEVDRLDIIIAHPRALRAYLDKNNVSNDLVRLGHPLVVNKGYFGFSKNPKLTHLKKRFEKVFLKLIKDKKINLNIDTSRL